MRHSLKDVHDSFFAYGVMIRLVEDVLEALKIWAEVCPCHYVACLNKHFRNKAFRGISKTSKFDSPNCPCDGKRAPELAAGRHIKLYKFPVVEARMSVIKCIAGLVQIMQTKIMTEWQVHLVCIGAQSKLLANSPLQVLRNRPYIPE